MSTQPVRVLKFGSSVLSSRREISQAVHEIYRELRDGSKVVAVVSALGRTTNRLLASARRASSRPESAALAHLLATGEAQSVALLAIALERAGISAAVLDPAQLALTSRGPLLDADPTGLDTEVLRRALREKSVAVIPGFVGRDEQGRTTLFGRGGSDLSALFVAKRLGASCRLLKDVPGVFDLDPTQHGGAARRFATLDWADALTLGKQVVQEKALRFALANRLEFQVGTPGSTAPTIVGRGPSCFAAPGSQPERMRVALLGLGTVGLGVYRELARFPDRFDVEAILVRRNGLVRPRGIPPELITTDVERVRSRKFDVVVEVLGGSEPAGTLIEDALRCGVDVVSANKGLIVERGAAYRALAAGSGACFLYSASVCGALPVLEVVRNMARVRRIVAVEGILNSTTNVVLDLFAQGRSLEDALVRARRQGFCESDPREDLDGTDAARKLALVAREAFGEDAGVHWIERKGIDEVDRAHVHAASHSGKSLRLVASCRRTNAGVELRLAPRWLDEDHALAATHAEHNAITIHTDDGASTVLRGKGAGRWPTTQSVVGDLLELSRLREREALVDSAFETSAAS